MSKAKVEIKTVTPNWASQQLAEHQKHLENGFRQRPMNENSIRRYAIDMKSGNWGVGGQGITFDVEGHLLDGQNRLAAVVRSGVEVDMVVVTGAKSEVNKNVKTIDTFDIGGKRNLGQQLKIDGFSYYAEIASTTRLLLLLSIASSTAKPQGSFSPTQGVVVAKLMQNTIMKIVEKVISTDAIHYRRGFILAPLTLMRTADPDTADLFISDLVDMSGLSKYSPVLHFIKFLQRPTNQRGGTDHQWAVMRALASALYSYSVGARVEHIRGNDEHFEWLLKASRNAIKQIRTVAGIELTMEELKQK